MNATMQALREFLSEHSELTEHPALHALLQALELEAFNEESMEAGQVIELCQFLSNYPNGVSSVEVCNKLSSRHIELGRECNVFFWKFPKGLSGGLMFLSNHGQSLLQDSEG